MCNLLYEAIALAAALLLLLQLHKLQLAESFEDVPKIILSNREVNVTDVKTVERNAVGLSGVTLGVAGLTILLCFSELCNDRNAE